MLYLGFFFVLSSFFGVWFIVSLLRCGVVRRLIAVFYLCGDDSDGQKRSDQFKISNMIISILNNWSHRNSSNYIIKFVSFIPIYYAINLDIVSSYMIFSYLYIESIDLLQV